MFAFFIPTPIFIFFSNDIFRATLLLCKLFANSSHSNSCNIREHEVQWIPDKIRMHQWLSLIWLVAIPSLFFLFFLLSFKKSFLHTQQMSMEEWKYGLCIMCAESFRFTGVFYNLQTASEWVSTTTPLLSATDSTDMDFYWKADGHPFKVYSLI